MDKILVKMLETTFGRSFIVGVFIAMATAISFLAIRYGAQEQAIQALNNRLIETEQRHKAENEARWKADIERSNEFLNRLERATKGMKRK